MWLKILDGHKTHGWLVAALLRDMPGLSGMSSLECVESCFSFSRCLRQGSVEAPRLWQDMATQILANVEEEWMRKRSGVLLDLEGEGVQICSSIWADNFWIISHSKENLEHKQLIEEASKWDIKPKPASLWWTSAYEPEEKVDMILGTTLGVLQISF